MPTRLQLTARTALVGATLVGLPPPVVGAQADARPSVELIEGIPFDSAGGRFFAPAPPAGVAAFEPATGHVVWSYRAAERPLAFDGRRLVAKLSSLTVHEFGVVVLDGRDGSLLNDLPTAHLPPDVPPGSYLELHTRLHGDTACVAWTALPPVIGGVPPPRNRPPPPHGVLRFQLAEGQVLPPADTGAAPVRPRVQEWILVNGVHVRVEQRDRLAILRRRRNGKMLRHVVVAQGLMAAAVLSADGRHVLGTTVIERPIQANLPELHAITIFETASGERVASGQLEAFPVPFLYVGGRLVYFVSPRDEIRAVDLRAGGTVYTRRAPGLVYHPGVAP